MTYTQEFDLEKSFVDKILNQNKEVEPSRQVEGYTRRDGRSIENGRGRLYQSKPHLYSVSTVFPLVIERLETNRTLLNKGTSQRYGDPIETLVRYRDLKMKRSLYRPVKIVYLFTYEHQDVSL